MKDVFAKLSNIFHKNVDKIDDDTAFKSLNSKQTAGAGGRTRALGSLSKCKYKKSKSICCKTADKALQAKKKRKENIQTNQLELDDLIRKNMLYPDADKSSNESSKKKKDRAGTKHEESYKDMKISKFDFRKCMDEAENETSTHPYNCNRVGSKRGVISRPACNRARP